jgi:hypothetical protein
MNRNQLGTILVIAVAAWAYAAPDSRGPSFDLSWHTVDGGGATFATGGGFTLGGTAGQPDAGPVMTGGDFTLVGGFWAAVTSGAPLGCLGDISNDGTVDAIDLGLLLGNWGVDGVGDLNGDNVVNAADLAIMLGAWGDCPG